jgi:hypothetical protein
MHQRFAPGCDNPVFQQAGSEIIVKKGQFQLAGFKPLFFLGTAEQAAVTGT